MYRIIIEDDNGLVKLDTRADKFVVLAKRGNEFSKSGEPSDLIDQLGIIHFALNRIMSEINTTNVPVRAMQGGGNNE